MGSRRLIGGRGVWWIKGGVGLVGKREDWRADEGGEEGVGWRVGGGGHG